MTPPPESRDSDRRQLPTRPKIEITACGNPTHLADMAALRARGVPLPHQFTTWSRSDLGHTWRWCRAVDASGQMITGMAVQLSWSRAVPGTRVGRIERLGRGLDDATVTRLGGILREVAGAFPLLQRLDVQLFEENAERLERLQAAVARAGGKPTEPRTYTRTLVLDLKGSDAELLSSLQGTTRRSIESFVADARTRTGPVEIKPYAERLDELHGYAFGRTGGTTPRLGIEELTLDTEDEGGSYLAGAFLNTRTRPNDLVGFAWGRLHDDHLEYSIGATERADDLKGVATGQALIWELCQWARARGASWVDLGGVIGPDADSSHPLAGISAFKRRFTKDERVVAAEYRFEPSRAIALLANLSRRIAGRVGGA